MLDDEEFKRVSKLRNSGTEGGIKERMFGPLLREYERITGIAKANPNAIYHHVLSMYGPPCKKCGKPMRTSKGKVVQFVHGTARLVVQRLVRAVEGNGFSLVVSNNEVPSLT
jgi:hypothetical protein